MEINEKLWVNEKEIGNPKPDIITMPPGSRTTCLM